MITVVIFIIILWYGVPFVLTFYNDVPFSFGPTGYMYNDHNFYLYSGIINRIQSDDLTYGNILAFLWMLLLPLSGFIYHLKLLYMICISKR